MTIQRGLALLICLVMLSCHHEGAQNDASEVPTNKHPVSDDVVSVEPRKDLESSVGKRVRGVAWGQSLNRD
jgi:hypothetical protein